MKRLVAAAVLAASPALADQDAFVEANLLSVFYHEMAHAVIDLMEVPIYGQEEDAADTMAVLLIDALYDEDAAQAIAYDSAFGYINDPDGTQEVAYWDLHGPDEQRFYNHICLFYGASPEDREDLAQDLGLPDTRAETCPEEFDQAISSWGEIFDEMENGSGESLILAPKSDAAPDAVFAVMEDEIAALNEQFTLPHSVEVRVAPCDEPNAFYDPEDVSIIICTEFIPHLEEIYQSLD